MNPFILLCRAAASLYLVRLVLFGIMSFATYASIYLLATSESASFLSSENGPLESLQVALVGSASLMFFIAAIKSHTYRACLTVMGAMAGYAAAREMDTVFESLLFDDAYKYVVGLPMLAAVGWTAWHDRARLMSDWAGLSRQPAFTLFMIGGLYLICVCQALDSPAFWGEATSTTTADNIASHPTKQMVEEYCEVFAYLLIGFSGVESIVMTFAGRKEQLDTESSSDSAASTISIASWQQKRRRAA